MLSYGFGTLLTDGDSNPKTAKSNAAGNYLTSIMHLAPAFSSGHNVCSSASAGCIAACLNTAGRGRTDMVQKTRVARTKLFFENRKNFIAQLYKELTRHVKRAGKLNKLPAMRLNGTSDIVWESVYPKIFDDFAEIQFYDYTKHEKRCRKNWVLPDNYHLTFSRSETNDKACDRILADGRHNVAVVFRTANYPKLWHGYSVYSADDTDLRFLDNGGKGGAVGGLYAKGKGKKDTTGFVLETESANV